MSPSHHHTSQLLQKTSLNYLWNPDFTFILPFTYINKRILAFLSTPLVSHLNELPSCLFTCFLSHISSHKPSPSRLLYLNSRHNFLLSLNPLLRTKCLLPHQPFCIIQLCIKDKICFGHFQNSSKSIRLIPRRCILDNEIIGKDPHNELLIKNESTMKYSQLFTSVILPRYVFFHVSWFIVLFSLFSATFH